MFLWEKNFKRKYLEEYVALNMKTANGKSRTNRELEEMSKGKNIVKWVKGAKDKLVRSPRENGGG